jgi:hypothetical protein
LYFILLFNVLFYRSNNEWNQKLENELIVIEISLKDNPKSYCAWHHRTWVIEQLSNPYWEGEFNLCNKYLDLDDRNCKLNISKLILNFQ